MVFSSAHAVIDLKAIADNLAIVRRTARASKIMAVVKANAYGHGAARVALHLQDADGFGVARILEAQELRDAGVKKPISLLEGFMDAGELDSANGLRLDVVVHSWQQVKLLKSQTFSASIWIKVTTGMNRLGFTLAELPEVLNGLSHCSVLGIMTHLAKADVDRAATNRQIESFLAAATTYGLPLSIANSAGILNYPESHVDWVRPGLMLYGASPFMQTDAGLNPAMTLSAPIIAVNQVEAGASVGYGSLWTAAKDSRIAVIAIGYGDGYPWSSCGAALVHGEPRPLAGRVSMDMTCIVLNDSDQVSVGDQVILWGTQLRLEEVAQASGTIPYTLMCHIGNRVLREYVS